MREQRENGKAYLGWVNAVKEALSEAVAVGGVTMCGTTEEGSNAELCHGSEPLAAASGSPSNDKPSTKNQ